MSLTPIIVNLLIRSRRSVFVDQFEKDKTIPDQIILEILENANAAPTHKLTEPWRFTAFCGAGLQILAEKQAAIYKENAGSSFKQNKYEKLLITPQQCSHAIAIGLKRNNTVPEIEEITAVSCAIENIYLSLAPYGIGGYLSTGGITYMEAAKELVGLGKEDIFIGFFYLGYIKIPTPHRTPGPIENKITWIR